MLRRLEIAALVALIILLSIFAFINGQFTNAFNLSPYGAYFYNEASWDALLTALECRDKRSWLAWYLALDFIFIIIYTISLYLFSSRIEKKRPRQFFLIILNCLLIADLIENVHFWMVNFETNIPNISGLKFIAAFILVGMLINYLIRQFTDDVRSVLLTLWYCRFTIVGIILMSFIMLNPQGRDLLVFMIQMPQNWLHILGLNVILLISTMVFWYMPRYLYPENPKIAEPGKERNLLDQLRGYINRLGTYKHWIGHFDADNYPPPESTDDDKEAPAYMRLERMAVKQMIRHEYDQLQKFQSAEALAPEPPNGVIPRLISIRKYTPIVLALLFQAEVFIYFIQVFRKANNRPESLQNYLIPSVILAVVIIAWFFDRNRKVIAKKIFHFLTRQSIIGAFFLFGSALIITSLYLEKDNFRPIILGQLFLVGGNITLLLAAANLEGNIRFKKWAHRIIFGLLMVCGIVFPLYLIFGTERFSMGLSVALVIGMFYYAIYILLSDKKNYREKADGRTYYLTILIFIALISLLVSTQIDNNHLDVSPMQASETQVEPLDLSRYIQEFKDQFKGYQPTDTVPIYFIAANGGGTMQAYWTASTLNYLRKQSNGAFKKHVFAMSGASGGAVGLGLSTLLWHQPDESITSQTNGIYRRDYLSGGLAYLLGSDIWLSPVPINIGGMANRNKWLYNKYQRSITDEIGEGLWDAPFRSIWTKNNQVTPLYIANTTRVENGERSFCAPISLGPNQTRGYNILDSLSSKTKMPTKSLGTLSFGQAVLLTNRFPYVNSSGKIDQLGHFVDGGYYDNSGAESLLELYDAVRPELFDSDTIYPVLAPHFIHINFGGTAWSQYSKEYPCPEDCNGLVALSEQSELLVPPLAAYQSLLGEKINNTIRTIDDKIAPVHQIYLPDPKIFTNHSLACIEPTYLQKFTDLEVMLDLIVIPLGRTISHNQQKYVEVVLNLLAELPPRAELDKILQSIKRE